MLTRGGYRVIKKDEAYLAGEFCKEILLEAGEGRRSIYRRERRKKGLVMTNRPLTCSLVGQVGKKIVFDGWRTMAAATLMGSTMVA
jgi:hypothetical protein